MIKNTKSKNSFSVSEPNLIPLLDFMLVLVIMFVLLVGPIRQAIKLPVPEVKKGNSSAIKKDSTLIAIIDKNNFQIGTNKFGSINDLEQHLKKQTISEITIAADKKLDVETLMKIFTLTKSLGINTANIQVENEK